MNQSDYDKVADGLLALARQIEVSKRPGYTRGDEDILANFKRTGVQAGVTTEQAWAVFFLKHIDAILSIMTRPDLEVSEAAEGRFADAINYLRLGFAILRERDGVEVRKATIAPRDVAIEKPRVDSIFTGVDESDYADQPVAVGRGYVPARKMAR